MFGPQDRDALHRIIRARRDIRQFRPDPISPDTLARILDAAHHAPSVGLSQPWNFILVRSLETRRRIKESFERANNAEAEKIGDPARKSLYRGLKLEGILESALNIAVTSDPGRAGPFILGRGPMPEMVRYSVCLAVQNMWLAARVEAIGMGWVSILDPGFVRRELQIPDGVDIVAYLCVGHPVEWGDKPMLEEVGWREPDHLSELVFSERWGIPPRPADPGTSPQATSSSTGATGSCPALPYAEPS